MTRIFYYIAVLFIGMVIVAAFGCSSDPVDHAVKILEDATQRVQNAADEEEAMRITEETGRELEDLNLKEKKLSAEQQQRLSDALVKYMQATMQAKIKTTGIGGSGYPENYSTTGERFVASPDTLD